MSDIVEWLRNSNSDEWCSGQLLKAADEIQRLQTELKESRRLFVRDTDEYIKWTDEAKAEVEKLRKALNGWQEWWELPREGKRPDIAELIYRRAAAAIRESGDE